MGDSSLHLFFTGGLTEVCTTPCTMLFFLVPPLIKLFKRTKILCQCLCHPCTGTVNLGGGTKGGTCQKPLFIC